jgi:hypothetical protein
MEADLAALEAAVVRTVPPTPQYCWPLLSQRIYGRPQIAEIAFQPTVAA